MDRFVTVTQGEVFYVTEALAQLEGLQRGPAGNTSLAAAISLAQEMDQESILVVQETEYTSAGKLPSSQLTFARKNGVTVERGDPRGNVPGQKIVIPEHPSQIAVKDIDLNSLRTSYIRHALSHVPPGGLSEEDKRFLAEDTRSARELVDEIISQMGGGQG